ncbi:MAG: hypothetical protein ACREGB_05230, partial [Candidatus Saccharimonadales bacterium]
TTHRCNLTISEKNGTVLMTIKWLLTMLMMVTAALSFTFAGAIWHEHAVWWLCGTLYFLGFMSLASVSMIGFDAGRASHSAKR